MRRHLESIDLDCGTWLRLDCGHPTPTDLRPGGMATCALCDRAQLPAGLIPEGPPRRHQAPWPTPAYELTAAAWTILTVEAGVVDLTSHGHSRRSLAAPARSVLVAGVRYRIAPEPGAVLTTQPLRHPRSRAASPREDLMETRS